MPAIDDSVELIESPLLQPVEDLVGYLCGAWKVHRVVQSLRPKGAWRFEGQLLVSKGPTGALTLDEQGVLSGADGSFEASRSLLLEPLGDGRGLVRFVDGQPFYLLDLSRGRSRMSHDCPPDLYSGVTLAEEVRWWVRWRCSGPEKQYVSTSLAERS